jgi:hypothetical protein
MTAKRLSLLTLFISTLAIAAAYASAFLPGGSPGWAPWAMALGTAAMMVAATALGAARPAGLGVLKVPFAITFLILIGGFGLALALPEEAPGTALILGLPLRAAVVLLGVGLLPLLVLPVAYALTFDAMTLSDADLDRVRRAAREARGEAPVPAPAAHAEPAEVA